MKTLILSLLTAVAAATAQAQQRSLAEMASEAGVDWLLGEWVSMRDDGVGTTMVFSVMLDGHAVKWVEFDRSGSRQKDTALIAYDPESDKVKHLGVDRNGGFSSGVWTAEGGEAILTTRQVTPKGQGGPLVTRFSKIDDKTMQMEVDLAPLLQDESSPIQSITVQFKRKS